MFVLSNSECISEWKNVILSELQNDEMILKVLGVTDDEIEEGLMYNRFFPFEYITQTQEIAKTYICVEIGINRDNDRRYSALVYVRPIITFRIVAHQNDNKITSFPTYKTKLDYLAELIDKKYNGKSIKGSNELELRCNIPSEISTTYRSRVVQFRGVDLDKKICN